MPALQKREENDSIKALVTRMKPAIEMALPRMVSPERFTRIVLTAISTNPQLKDCSQMSFLGALMNAAQLGLEPNTPMGAAYLIPRNVKGKMECVFQIGYKGLLDLCYRTGEYVGITAEAVHEKDFFEIEYGLHRDLKHKPATGDRGAVIGYYATYLLKNGAGNFVYMTRDEVQKHREKYSPTRSAASPWNTNFDAMAKKTVIIKALKYAPKAAEIDRAIATDNTIKRLDVQPGDIPSIVDIETAPAEYYEPEEAVPVPQTTAVYTESDSLL